MGYAVLPTIGGIILYNILYAFVNEKGVTAVYTSVLVGAVPYEVPALIFIIPAWVVEAGFIILLNTNPMLADRAAVELAVVRLSITVTDPPPPPIPMMVAPVTSIDPVTVKLSICAPLVT